MPKKSYSRELIADVHRRVSAGQAVRAIARALDVPRSTVMSILQRTGNLPVPVEVQQLLVDPAVGSLPQQPRLLLHPWLREPAPLPTDVNCHPTVAKLYRDALEAEPVRASELDILTIAFDLSVPRIRAYLNVVAAERLRGRFDLTETEDTTTPTPSGRLTLPRALWEAALARLRVAFDVQEGEIAATRDRLLAALPPTVCPDDV